MPASVMTNSLPAAALAVQHAREQHARVADEEAARLDDQRQPVAPPTATIDRRERVEVGRRLVVVGHGEAAADVEILEIATPERRASAASSSSSRSHALPRYGSSAVSCEPMCMSRPRSAMPAMPNARLATPSASSYGMPNFMPLLAGRVYGCGVSTVTSGFTRSATGAARPMLARDAVELAELRLGLDVEEQDAGAQRLAQLLLRLPHAAEHDVAAREARAQRAIQLAARHDVHAGAQLAQQREDRQRSSSP